MKARGSTLVFSLVLGLMLAAVSPALAAGSAPAIHSESVPYRSPSDVTLEAKIDPRSTERGAYYQFQVVTHTSEFRPEFTCPTEGGLAGSSFCSTVPSQPGALPIGWIEPGTGDKSVSLDLASAGMSLQPGTTYDWRVITARAMPTEDTIEWEAPIVYGKRVGFWLPGGGGAWPMIEGMAVSNLTPTDATLEAWINPRGLETSYEFELIEGWWCEPSCEPPIYFYSLPGGQLPASSESQHVVLDLNSVGVYPSSLNVDYWTVVATNSAGTAWGPWAEFAPPRFPPEEPEPPVEPPEEEPGPAEEPPAEEGQGSSEEEPEVVEPPLHAGSPGAPQAEESGPPPPTPSGGPLQGSPKAPPCRRPARHRHGKHHRRHRAGIGRGCHPV